MERREAQLLTTFSRFSGRWRAQAMVQLVAILALVVRVILTLNTALNKEWNIDPISLLNVTVCPQMRIELLSINVVFLGLLLSVSYTVSIVNCLYWLRIVQQHVQENIFRVRKLWCNGSNILVLGATCVSVIDAFWFFLFVREVWTYRFDMAFQILQLVPSLFVIFDTIFNGLLICAMSVLDEDQQAAIPRGYQTDINAHMGSNILLAMYAVMNLLVARKCHGPDSTVITEFVPLFVVFELICRNFLVYHLRHSRSVIRGDAALEKPQENELLNTQPNLSDNDDHMIDEDEAANEDHMIDCEKPRLYDEPVVTLGEQNNYIQRDKVEVDSNNLQSSDDSATSSLSSYTGSANEYFGFSAICSEDAQINVRRIRTVVINAPFITVNTQCGGESEEPLKPFHIELED